MFCTVRSVVVTAVVWCAMVSIALAKLPGAADAKAPTGGAYSRAIVPFNKETLAGAYLRVGKTNPEWDDAAVAFLDDMAIHFSNSGTTAISTMPDVTPLKELVDAGKALVDDGCDDPLVLYCHGANLQESGNVTAANAALAQAGEGMLKSEYPLFRRLRAVDRWLDALPANKRPVDAVQFLSDNLIAIASSPECKGLGRRLMISIWRDVWRNIKPAEKRKMIDAMLADPKADNWFSHTVAGEYYIEAAWQSRGGGYANTVTEKGWEGFRKNLALAKDELSAAYDVEPTYPEAPTKMITVAMGAGRDLGIDDRQWFDRAIKAQIDYKPAFDAYMNALLPRWGGSHLAMFQVATECAQANRYDTDLPIRFVEILDAIANDDGASFVLTPAVYEVAEPVFDQLAAVKHREFSRYQLTYKFMFEMKLRRYDDARTTLTALDDKPSEPQPLGRYGMVAETLVGKLHAMTGPQKDAMLAIEKRVLAGETDVIADLRKVRDQLAATDANDPAVRFLSNKAQIDEWSTAIADGKPLDVQPKADLGGWNTLRGTWSVDADGTLVGKPDRDGGGADILLGIDAGQTYTLRGTMIVEPDSKAVAGVLVAYHSSTQQYAMWIDDAANAATMRCGYGHTTRNGKVFHTNEVPFEIRVKDGEMEADLDGKPVFTKFPFNHGVGTESKKIGLGILRMPGKEVVKFKGLTLQRIEE